MGFLQDFKFGLRMLAKNPVFALIAVITIALGIGINSTVFTLTNAVLLKGLPFENPETICIWFLTDLPHGRQRMPMSLWTLRIFAIVEELYWNGRLCAPRDRSGR
jgi:putative ABC transport system permease protein